MAAKSVKAEPASDALPDGAIPILHTEPNLQRGRPPLPPKTEAARWIRANGHTVQSFAAAMPEAAVKVGLPRSAAPQAKTLLDAVNGRHWPSAPTMLIVRHMTAGAIDLQHWVADLYRS